MKKATREFIKARQPYANGMDIKLIESVKRIGGGVANKCYQNAWDAKEKYGGIMMSGWLVQEYKPKLYSTGIIQHWWNVDSDGNHFDTSPITAANEEYVQDFALYQFCVENDDRLDTHLAKSLLLQNGKFSVLIDFDSMLFKAVSELRTEHLYTLK